MKTTPMHVAVITGSPLRTPGTVTMWGCSVWNSVAIKAPLAHVGDGAPRRTPGEKRGVIGHSNLSAGKYVA
jgi:hypothetical protein